MNKLVPILFALAMAMLTILAVAFVAFSPSASASTNVDTDIFQARHGVVKVNTDAPRYTHIRYLVDGRQFSTRTLVPRSGEVYEGLVVGQGQYKVCVQHRRTSRDRWVTVDCDYEQVWGRVSNDFVGTLLRY